MGYVNYCLQLMKIIFLLIVVFSYYTSKAQLDYSRNQDISSVGYINQESYNLKAGINYQSIDIKGYAGWIRYFEKSSVLLENRINERNFLGGRVQQWFGGSKAYSIQPRVTWHYRFQSNKVKVIPGLEMGATVNRIDLTKVYQLVPWVFDSIYPSKPVFSEVRPSLMAGLSVLGEKNNLHFSINNLEKLKKRDSEWADVFLVFNPATVNTIFRHSFDSDSVKKIRGVNFNLNFTISPGTFLVFEHSLLLRYGYEVSRNDLSTKRFLRLLLPNVPLQRFGHDFLISSTMSPLNYRTVANGAGLGFLFREFTLNYGIRYSSETKIFKIKYSWSRYSSNPRPIFEGISSNLFSMPIHEVTVQYYFK